MGTKLDPSELGNGQFEKRKRSRTQITDAYLCLSTMGPDLVSYIEEILDDELNTNVVLDDVVVLFFLTERRRTLNGLFGDT